MIKRLIAIGVVVLFSVTLFICPMYAEFESGSCTYPKLESSCFEIIGWASYIPFRNLRELTSWSTDIVRGRIVERYGAHCRYFGLERYSHSIYVVKLNMVYKGNRKVGELMEISQFRSNPYVVLSYDNEYVFFVRGGGELPPGIMPYDSVYLFCENTYELTNAFHRPISNFTATYADLQRIAERSIWTTVLVLFLSGGVVGFITIKVIKKKHR